MNPTTLCASIGDSLPSLFECAEAPEGAIRVRTPFMYPDGDIVDIFVEDHRTGYLLTDYGETMNWLRTQTFSGELTTNQLLMIEDVCTTLGVRLYDSQLTLECSGVSELGDSVTRLGQAGVRVSDVWFTFRSRAVRSVADEVDEWLFERTFRYRRSVKRQGRSGRQWTVDYQVLDKIGESRDRESLVFLLSASSTSRARQVSERVVAACIDLSHLIFHPPQTSFIALFDDTSKVWRDDDYRLVADVSRTVAWSRSDEFERMLTSDWSPPPVALAPR